MCRVSELEVSFRRFFSFTAFLGAWPPACIPLWLLRRRASIDPASPFTVIFPALSTPEDLLRRLVNDPPSGFGDGDLERSLSVSPKAADVVVRPPFSSAPGQELFLGKASLCDASVGKVFSVERRCKEEAVFPEPPLMTIEVFWFSFSPQIEVTLGSDTRTVLGVPSARKMVRR